MPDKPTYEELERRIRELEKAKSEFKQQETVLKENEKFMKDVLKASSVCISYTRDRKILWANEAMEELFGFENEKEYLGMDTAELFASEAEYARIGEMLYEQNRDDKIVYYDTTFVKKNGACFSGLVRVNLFDVDDVNKGVIVSVIDITERKNAEEALRHSEERFRSLVENTADGFFVIQLPSCRFLFLNQSICEMSGYDLQEALTKTIWDVIEPGEHAIAMERIQARIENRLQDFSSNTYTIIRKDGARFKAEISASPITYQGETAVQGILRDVTEKLRLQMQLQQSQKMEAIGTLAGGIAHDFNNLLMGIQGRASLAALELGPTHPQLEHIQAIEEHVQSATHLTKQLLGFAREGKYDVAPIELNELLAASADMFGRTHKELEIHMNPHPGAVVVEADRQQIEQVLLNIYINAWQAMPGGGQLYIETSLVDFREETQNLQNLSPGRYVKISITDTGVGMDEATRQRIFDPFFTTKDKSRGTGLGLASAYGIIRNHGGTITAYSESGHGTTFSIYLPETDGQYRREPVVEETPVTGSETILLVDDEEIIQEVACVMLEKLGYTVMVAKSGQEAIDAMTERKNVVDLVILDLIMPGMDGGETFGRIREIRPDIPVLLSSGYALNGQASMVMEKGCNGFIQKPFNLNELSQKVRSILDENKISTEP